MADEVHDDHELKNLTLGELWSLLRDMDPEQEHNEVQRDTTNLPD